MVFGQVLGQLNAASADRFALLHDEAGPCQDLYSPFWIALRTTAPHPISSRMVAPGARTVLYVLASEI